MQNAPLRGNALQNGCEQVRCPQDAEGTTQPMTAWSFNLPKTNIMTTLVLLMLVLTYGAYVAMGAPALARSTEPVQNGAEDAPLHSWRHTALRFAVLVLLVAHVAQTSNLPQAAMQAGGQDEISWAMRAQATEPAPADAPALREGE